MYTACFFFGFVFLLFNDVDIPQVALLRAFFALAQKDKGQINDKINVYGYNGCPGCLCLFLSLFFYFLLQQNTSVRISLSISHVNVFTLINT